MSSHRCMLCPTALALCLATSAPVRAAAAVSAPVAAAVTDPGRVPDDLARDADMKPADVLAFSGIAPGQTVAMLMSGTSGDTYYLRMVAKLVGPRGHVYAVVPLSGFRDARELREAAKGKLLPVDDVLAIQNLSEYQNVTVLWENLSQNGGQFPLPVQIDAAFFYGDYHELHTAALGSPDAKAVDTALLRALKPGGTLVVADSVAADGAGFGAAESLQRSEPAAVMAEVTGAGFTFADRRNILANAGDDHAMPAGAGTAADKADRFLMRFTKPQGAPGPERPADDPIANYYGNTYIYNMGPTERHHLYHADGTYQEFGKSDMQEGTWFWDQRGNFCLLHQAPAPQRQYNFCAPDIRAHSVGSTWLTTRVNRGTTTQTLLRGYVYPK